jgi:hypothetical protein
MVVSVLLLETTSGKGAAVGREPLRIGDSTMPNQPDYRPIRPPLGF